MPNTVILSTGEYLTNAFIGPNGKWFHVGIDSSRRSVMDCMDTFKNLDTGVFKEIRRADVFSSAEKGIIQASQHDYKPTIAQLTEVKDTQLTDQFLLQL